jgi:hypothetical protein
MSGRDVRPDTMSIILSIYIVKTLGLIRAEISCTLRYVLVRSVILVANRGGLEMGVSGGGVAAMAKKKAPKPKGQPWGESKPVAATLRGTDEWKAWLEEFAKTNRQSVAGIIDMALTRLAKDLSFRVPPER